MVFPCNPNLIEHATGESDTLFNFSITRAEALILMLVIAGILFFIILKTYDMYKQRYWSIRSNRVSAVKKILNKSNKEIHELIQEDLIDNNLITLYEYYDRSVDKCISDLSGELGLPSGHKNESKNISSELESDISK